MAREYATQMEAARKGIITEELKSVAKKERMSVEELLPLVAEGKVVICANKNHKCIDPHFRKFHSTIFCALRRMAALDSSERYTVSTSPPSAST